jgi:hypothetical protein
MKHSHFVRVTRLSHPNEFAFGFRLGCAESPARPEVDFAFEFTV